MPAGDREHRTALRDAAQALCCALDAQLNGDEAKTSMSSKDRRGQECNIKDLTPEEEVLLLHVLE
jgi:hypothetical protein